MSSSTRTSTELGESSTTSSAANATRYERIQAGITTSMFSNDDPPLVSSRGDGLRVAGEHLYRDCLQPAGWTQFGCNPIVFRAPGGTKESEHAEGTTQLTGYGALFRKCEQVGGRTSLYHYCKRIADVGLATSQSPQKISTTARASVRDRNVLDSVRERNDPSVPPSKGMYSSQLPESRPPTSTKANTTMSYSSGASKVDTTTYPASRRNARINNNLPPFRSNKNEFVVSTSASNADNQSGTDDKTGSKTYQFVVSVDASNNPTYATTSKNIPMEDPQQFIANKPSLKDRLDALDAFFVGTVTNNTPFARMEALEQVIGIVPPLTCSTPLIGRIESLEDLQQCVYAIDRALFGPSLPQPSGLMASDILSAVEEQVTSRNHKQSNTSAQQQQQPSSNAGTTIVQRVQDLEQQLAGFL